MKGRSFAFAAVWGTLILTAWTAGGVLVSYATAAALSSYPGMATAVIAAVAVVVAYGTLIRVGIASDGVISWKRGYRVRCLDAKVRARLFGVRRGDLFNCVYEERAPSGETWALSFVREIVGDGYPAANEVLVPTETRWDDEMPSWAKSRRGAILQRIGDEFGERTRFVGRKID